jgi:hypothetical protein
LKKENGVIISKWKNIHLKLSKKKETSRNDLSEFVMRLKPSGTVKVAKQVSHKSKHPKSRNEVNSLIFIFLKLEALISQGRRKCVTEIFSFWY